VGSYRGVKHLRGFAETNEAQWRGLFVLYCLPIGAVSSSLGYPIGAEESMTYVAVVVKLVGVVMLASCVPARRAMRVDPLAALRYD
jgi:putative ABC transport system permease protein